MYITYSHKMVLIELDSFKKEKKVDGQGRSPYKMRTKYMFYTNTNLYSTIIYVRTPTNQKKIINILRMWWMEGDSVSFSWVVYNCSRVYLVLYNTILLRDKGGKLYY